MPPVLKGRPERPPLIQVPRRVGLSLRPEDSRAHIPNHPTLDVKAPPYTGELREEMNGETNTAMGVGESRVLVTLRRAWNFIGFSVDNSLNAGAGVTARLRVLTKGGVNGFIGAPLAVPAATITAFPGFIVGARVELVIVNGTAAPIGRVRASLWGMGER